MTTIRRIAPLIVFSMPASYVLWIVFVGTFSLHELALGIVATILVVAGMVVIDVQYPARFAPSVGELLSVWRLPWYLVAGTWKVLMIAARDLAGVDKAESLFLLVPFKAGGRESPRAVARRVLAVVYSTMTPETIVLGINTGTKQMLLHELKPSPLPKMTQELGARP